VSRVSALLVCTLFVAFLLNMERKRATGLSRALWIPTIWILLVASKPLATWFGVVGDPTAGSLLDRTVLSGLGCLALLVLASRQFHWPSAMKTYASLMLLIGVMLISLLWSRIPAISFKRWIRELIAVVMAFIVLTERDPREAALSVLKRSVFVLIPFSLLLIKYYPELGVEYGRWTGDRSWIGVTMQKNALGRVSIVATFVLLWTLSRKSDGQGIPLRRCQRLGDASVLLMSLWLLKGAPGSYSATGIAALAVGLGAYVALMLIRRSQIQLSLGLLTGLVAFVIAFGVITVFVGGSSVKAVISVLGRDTTLTGRTMVWAALIPVVVSRPLLGGGFGSFWTYESRLFYEISDSHSGYLDVLLELGLLGMLFFGGFLLAFCRRAYREMSNDFDWASFCLCFLFMVLIHNIAETSLSSFTSYPMAALLLLSASLRAGTRSTLGAT